MTPSCWLDERGRIYEAAFCHDFLKEHPLHYISGRFTGPDGVVVEESALQQTIFEMVCPYVASGVAKKVTAILNALRILCYREPPRPEPDCVRLANGCYRLGRGFRQEGEICLNRLPVSYDPTAPMPFRWLLFLERLLYPEDIPTLQEYLGYCLLPTTRAQKMLMLIGQGGEGKSQVGHVMEVLLGRSMVTSSIQKVETNRFARADLEGKLLMVDDDMDMSALPKTNYLKTLITNQGLTDVERKGIQSYQANLYARFLCFGNGALTALYDHTDGFYRRQIILTTRDKDPERKDDPFLAEKLEQEAQGILLWMLEGLERLAGNGYRFTISPRAKANAADQRKAGCSIESFLHSEGYITFHPGAKASTRSLCAAYRTWCDDNAERPLADRSFATYLSSNAQRLGLTGTSNIPLPGGKHCRGYHGIGVVDPGVRW